jgi:hypothetical protein
MPHTNNPNEDDRHKAEDSRIRVAASMARRATTGEAARRARAGTAAAARRAGRGAKAAGRAYWRYSGRATERMEEAAKERAERRTVAGVLQRLQVGGRIRAVALELDEHDRAARVEREQVEAVAQPLEAAVLGGDDEQVVVCATGVGDDAGVGDYPFPQIILFDAHIRERGGPQALGWGVGGDAVHAVRNLADDKSLWVAIGSREILLCSTTLHGC